MRFTILYVLLFTFALNTTFPVFGMEVGAGKISRHARLAEAEARNKKMDAIVRPLIENVKNPDIRTDGGYDSDGEAPISTRSLWLGASAYLLTVCAVVYLAYRYFKKSSNSGQ